MLGFLFCAHIKEHSGKKKTMARNTQFSDMTTVSQSLVKKFLSKVACKINLPSL